MNIHIQRLVVLIIASAVLAAVGGGVYVLAMQIPITPRAVTNDTEIQQTNQTPTDKIQSTNMTPGITKAATTASPTKIATKGLEGFIKLSNNSTIQLNQSVTIRFTTTAFISAEEVNKAKGTALAGNLIKPENQGLAVYFEMKNTSLDPQSVLGIGETSPFIVTDDAGNSILAKDSLINPFNAAALITIPANQTVTNALLFEIPKTYTQTKGLNLVYSHASFQPNKGYLPL